MDQKHSKMFWRQWEKMPILGRCSPHRLDDNAATALQPESVSVILDQIEIQKAREAGSVYVGYQMWRRLQLDAIPRKAGLNERTRLLTEVMTINRLGDSFLRARHAGLGAPHGAGRPAAYPLDNSQTPFNVPCGIVWLNPFPMENGHQVGHQNARSAGWRSRGRVGVGVHFSTQTDRFGGVLRR